MSSLCLTMKRTTYLIAFVLLCIQQCSIGVPVGKDDEIQWVYSYLGYIDTRSSACDERIARMTISANLTIQRNNHDYICQLDNIKTSLFNGPKADIALSHEEDAPKEADELKLPFRFTEALELFVDRLDAPFSVNLKRGIASNFHQFVGENVFQKSVFGDCETSYDLKDKNRIIKTINHKSCKDTPDKHVSNVQGAPVPDDFETIRRETVIEFNSDIDNQNIIRSIHSVSKLSYQHMPKSPNTQHIDQHLQLDLLTYSLDFEHINIDKLTDRKSIIFEYDIFSEGRHVHDTAEQLATKFFQYYDKFEKYLEAKPIPNRVNDTDNPMEHMFYCITEQPGVKFLQELYDQMQSKANCQMYSTFMSILPYTGDSFSVKLINNLIEKGEIQTAPYMAVKLLATFPNYIIEPTIERVENFEVLFNVENVTSDIIKNSQILSFASVVARAIEKDTISEKPLNKYIKLYHNIYLKGDVYEEKMTALLGLINMAQGLKNQFIMDIIIDSTQPVNLRSLAIAGFKNRLLQSNPLRIFSIFWPMVQDKKENFDIRAQALDFILSSGVTDEEFKIVLDAYKNYQVDDIHGKHLANYFLSFIESHQNHTLYFNQIGKFATKVLEEEHFPIFSREWLTGNYLLSYRDSDPNIGAYLETKLIANPILNTISTIQFVTNRFAFSFETGECKVYLKLHGAIELLYKTEFFKHITEETTVPELLAIIKEFDFKMKKRAQDFHIEVVVFVDDKAVFATTFNSENMTAVESKWKQFVDIFDRPAENTFSISFPIMDYRSFPSVLGTPLNINNDMQQVTDYGFQKNDLKYRSSWSFETRLKAYNPLLDTSIISYKYYGDEIGIRTKPSINFRNLGVGWTVKKDSFSRVWDHLIGTAVQHEHILKKFCSDCDATHEIPTDLNTHNRIREFPNLGMYLNHSIETNDEEYYKESELDTFNEFISTHHSNANAVPFAKPFLVILHYIQFKNYFKKELQRGSTHSIPLDEDGVQTLVKLDFAAKPFVNTVSPIHDTHKNFSLNVFNKKMENDDEAVINSWKLLLELKSTHNHKDEQGKDKIMLNQNIYYHESETNENKTGVNLCWSRVELLPAVRSDRFSLVPIEETTATTISRQDHTAANHSEIRCSDNKTVTFTESFIVTDAINKKVKESADYKECQKESVGLKFVPPTRACIASFLATSQYSQHKINAEIKNVNDFYSTDLDKNHLFEANRVDNNKVKFELLASPFTRNSSVKYFKYTTYYPYHTINPVAEVYHQSSIFKRSCIVTPKQIQSFTGHNIPIDGSKQVAFVECFERARRGMTIEKVSDTHVGFRWWSGDNIIDATVQGDNIKLALNGHNLQESHVSEDQSFSVEFLDTNVVLIADDKIYIYYNTEYIYINAHSVYNDLICGVCNQV